MSMLENLKKKLETLPKNSVVLLIVPHQQHHEVTSFLVRYLLDISNDNGTFISLNRPYNNVLETFNLTKKDKLFFIDGVTKNELDIPNCYFLKSLDLKKLNLAISSKIKQKDSSFFIMDSINSLSLCHSHDDVLKFSKSFIQQLKSKNINSILVSTPDNEPLLQQIGCHVDKIIDLTENF